jgi:malate dehydrogenase (oxaloacetate-decarboxylating)
MIFPFSIYLKNGTAVLGFGDIGPEAALPVMEGKSVLFKCLAGLDIMPICLKEKNVDKVVKLVKM